MREGALELLLKKAKEMEKKYKWLQATKVYDQASGLALKKQNFLRASELQERKGFCFFRAAFQAQTNIEFQKLLKNSIQAYQKESEIIGAKGDNQLIVSQANALIAYTRSWLETNVAKKKLLLDDWWALENQVLEAYQSIQDIHSVGVTCTDMIEFSQYTESWLRGYQERGRVQNEALNLAEKAIEALLKSGDDYELARAYCFASIWCSLKFNDKSPQFDEKCAQILQKGQDYSKKALNLSLKTGDAWLIGNSYISAKNIASSRGSTFRLAAAYIEKIPKYGRITKDKRIIIGVILNPVVISALVEFLEDPDKQREVCEKIGRMAQACVHASKIMGYIIGVSEGYSMEAVALNWLSRIETDLSKRQTMLKNSVKICRQVLELAKDWIIHGFFYPQLSVSLSLLATTKSDVEEKKALLIEAYSYQEKGLAYLEEYLPFHYGMQSLQYYLLALKQKDLADIETCKKIKVEMLEKAVATLEKSIELVKRLKLLAGTVFYFQVLGKHNYRLARILQQIYYLTKNKKRISQAIETHRMAATAFARGGLPAHAAEAYWQTAQLQGQISENMKAFRNYEEASIAYKNAATKTSQLKDFYTDYSHYMQAWSQIEQAILNHSIEEYEKAKEHYEKAAELHKSTESWNYLASNYFAWANMEEAENQSRQENTQQAKEAFQKALERFIIAEKSIKNRTREIPSIEEKELDLRLLQALDFRRRFCQARIQIEEAKLLDRQGKYLQSSRRYGEAAKELDSIIEKTEIDCERKELEFLATLCKAWEKMAIAEEITSSESYLDAARLFEQAKDHCYTKKASLWILGNSSFCKGLAAGAKYQTDLDLEDHAKAKGYMKNASTKYLQAGFKNASEYAKATQRLFDAYVFMNQAERELDQQKRAKLYQMAENLLQIAAGSFIKAKQPEKTTQVHKILTTVREEKALAVSLNEVMHAPTITSSTMSFTAPSPTSEASVGLEQFQHANVQANLIADLKEVKVGESFCLTVEFVNAGKEPALLTRVENFVPPNFIVVKKPKIYRLEDSCLNMKGKQVAPLKLVEAKLVLQSLKKGFYHLSPVVHYLDELGQNKSLQPKSVEIKVEEVILANRVSTGTKELDSLLLGGIPKEYAVVLTGPPSDERAALIQNFLEAGAENEVVFYVTTETNKLENFLENPNFHLFLCNPKPKTAIPNLPNVTWLKSKTDLNNLNMALVRASRDVQQKQGIKRIVLGNVSDVLLKDGPEVTRRWLSELITELSSKGFTVLAVLDSGMHTSEEANAIAYLFDGEINLTQTGVPPDCRKSLIIKKLRGQDYIKNPICLTKS